jgi:hypothetical protein
MTCNMGTWIGYPNSRRNDLLPPQGEDDADSDVFCAPDASLEEDWEGGQKVVAAPLDSDIGLQPVKSEPSFANVKYIVQRLQL